MTGFFPQKLDSADSARTMVFIGWGELAFRTDGMLKKSDVLKIVEGINFVYVTIW